MTRTLTSLTITASVFSALLFCGCGEEQNPAAPANKAPVAKPATIQSSEVATAENPAKEKGQPADTRPPVTENGKKPTTVEKASGQDVAAETPANPMTDTPQPKKWEIPEGPPEAIMAFIQQLEEGRPDGDTQDELLAYIRKVYDTQVAGCEKILAGDANPEIHFSAVMMKLDALGVLTDMEQPGARAKLVEFSNSLLDNDNADIVRQARLQSFEFMVEDFIAAEATDFAPIAKELSELLKDEHSHPQLVDVGQRAANRLYRDDYEGEAAQVIKSIGTTLLENAELAEIAANLIDQAMMIELDFSAKMEAAVEGEPGAAAELVTALQSLMETGEASSTDLQTAATAAKYMEIVGEYDAAVQIHQLVEQRCKDHSKPDLAGPAAQQAAYGLKRLGLVGQPFQVTGVAHDGQAFDWSAYEGKVVLVDFWATWCGPCLDELPNVEENYQKFHDKGFEVVGVNLDDDSAAVAQFFTERTLPWTTVVSGDPAAQGFGNPLVDQCGIEAIPFLVLVGRDGKVVALHVRGPELETRLTALLGDSSG